MDLEDVKSAYPKLLRKYLFEGKEEEALYEAYKLGKECFEAKIGIEDITSLHTQSLENILRTLPPSSVTDTVLKSSNLLIEFSTRFGLICQNYFEILQKTDEKIRNAFYQAGEALTAGLDVQRMLSVILEIAKNFIDATGCAILLLEEDRTVIKTSEGLDAEKEIFKESLFGVIQEGKPKFVNDLKEIASSILLNDGREIRSFLAFPLILKGKTRGGLGIYLTHPHIYEEKEINLLTSFAHQVASGINNAYLFSELERHGKTLETLYSIDRAISQILDLETIFQNALSKAMEVTETEAGGIYLLEEDDETLTLKAHLGISQELSASLSKIKVGQGVSGTAVKTRKPVTMDIKEYPSPEILSPLIKEKIVSIVGVPLIAKGKVLGAMTLANRKKRSFSRDEMDILASIGSQIGVAIENATLFGELEKHHKMLETLYTIENVVSRSLDLDEIFNVALSSALKVTDTEAGTLYSFDGEVLHLETFEGISPEFKKKAAIRKMGEGIPGIAAQSKKAISMDISQYPSKSLLPYVTKERLVSFIGTPLLSKGKIVGALALGTKKKRSFSQDDLDLLISIGSVIGIAVENATLYKEVKDKAEHISVLYRIVRAVKAGLDSREVFDAMVGEMKNILSFDRTSICLLKEGEIEVFALVEEIEIPELGRGTKLPRDKSSNGFVIDRRAGIIRSLENTPFYEDEFLFKKSIRSVIQVPLISKGEIIGVFNLEDSIPDAYTSRDLGISQSIADQIAISIENVRLYEDLKQANLKLEKKIRELEEFHTLAVGRELRMIELKEKIKSLEERR
jgi:GAF domain-containing protein